MAVKKRWHEDVHYCSKPCWSQRNVKSIYSHKQKLDHSQSNLLVFQEKRVKKKKIVMQECQRFDCMLQIIS